MAIPQPELAPAVTPPPPTNSPSRRRSTRRFAFALLAWATLWLVSLAASPPAAAHATLLRADPAIGGTFRDGPTTITLWFSEPIEEEYSRIDLLRRDGSRLLADDLASLDDSGDPALRLTLNEPLPEGSYTIVWSVLSSVDGHVSDGYFSFAVGSAILPGPAEAAALARTAATDKVVPQAVDATVRWLNLLGQAALAGAVLFIPYVLIPTLSAAERPAAVPVVRFRVLLLAACSTAILAHQAAAVIQVMNATRSTSLETLGQPLWSLLTDTRYGTLWIARLVLLLALGLVIAALTWRESLVTTDGRGQLLWNWAIWLAALVLLTTSLSSHSAARGGTYSWQVANDWLHLLSTSVWIGGLLALVLSWPLASRAGSGPQLLRRFSWLALAAFALLAITGLLAARREVVSLDGLLATRYGLWFTLKLAIVAAAVGFGAWHWLVVRPALEAGKGRAATRAARSFQRSLPIEVLLLIAVVAATGLLTSSIPARDLLDPGTRLFATTRLTADASVTLRVTPGQVGVNEFSVVVGPVDPASFGEPDAVTLRFSHPDHPDQRVPLRQAGPSDPLTFLGAGGYIALDGDWQISAIIQRAGQPDLEAAFAVTASDDGLRPTGLPAPDSDRATLPLLLGALWLLGALTLATAAWYLRRRARPALSFGILTVATLAAALGAILILSTGSLT